MEQKLKTVNLVEFWGLPPLIPFLQCVNWLGLRFVLLTEQGSLVTLI